MKQLKLISWNVDNHLLKPLLKENNQNPVLTKSLIIKFNSAKISHVVIKLNRKPKNIIAILGNLQSQQKNTNYDQLEYINFNYFTNENEKFIYNCSVNKNQYYTSLQIKLEQNDVGFFNIQLYGYEAVLEKQNTLDNQILPPQQQRNTKKEQTESHYMDINEIQQREKKQLQEAVENSLISAQLEEINKQQIKESIKNTQNFYQIQEKEFQQDQDPSSVIFIDVLDIRKYQYEQQKQPQINENLGYTDNNKNISKFGLKNNTQKEQQKSQSDGDDQIKLYFMTKYTAGDINKAFMKMHQLLEETSGAKRFLENVMYN